MASRVVYTLILQEKKSSPGIFERVGLATWSERTRSGAVESREEAVVAPTNRRLKRKKPWPQSNEEILLAALAFSLTENNRLPTVTGSGCSRVEDQPICFLRVTFSCRRTGNGGLESYSPAVSWSPIAMQLTNAQFLLPACDTDQ